MRRLQPWILFVGLFAISANAAFAKSVMEQFLFSTVYIKNLNAGSAGSGFIVSREVSEKKSVIFLVSNRHVLLPKPPNPKSTNHLAQAEISINTAEQDKIKRQNLTVTLRNTTGEVNVRAHHNTGVDVAALIITPYLQEIIKGGSKLNFIPELRFATREFIKEQFVSVGDAALVIGYPLNLVEDGHVIPVARHAVIATKPEYDFRGKPLFLIDATIVRGSSGSPVLLPITPYVWEEKDKVNVGKIQQNYLVGIVSGTMKDWELVLRKIISPEIQQEITVTDKAGFGLVFRAETVSEVLDLFGYPRWKK
jgi:hypothetical protein